MNRRVDARYWTIWTLGAVAFFTLSVAIGRGLS